jgi:hypothetical protein
VVVQTLMVTVLPMLMINVLILLVLLPIVDALGQTLIVMAY